MERIQVTFILVSIILLSSLTPLSWVRLQNTKNNYVELSALPRSKYLPSANKPIAYPLDYPPISALTWEYVIISTHFSVYYTTSGPDAATHEYAQNVSNAFEYSWNTEVGDFGFDAPPDPHITVYIKDLPPFTFGYTHWILGHVDYIEIDNALTPGLANATCAHEFFHAVQLSYDIGEADWIIEGTAVWMESKVYPEYTAYPSYVDRVNTYMTSPDRTITQLDYDAVLYWIFLEEHYGGISTIEDVLQETRSKDGIDAVNATLNKQGTIFSEVFKEWTIANYLKDSYYTKGYLFHKVTTVTLEYEGASLTFDSDVGDWGADYIEISSSVIYMPLKFIGKQSHNLTKILVEHGFPLVSDFTLLTSHTGDFNLTQANNLDKVVVIVRSLGSETSNNRVDYSLHLPSSSYTLEGPYYLVSSSIVITVTETSGTFFSSIVAFAVVKTISSQNSSTLTVVTVNRSSTETCSPKTLTVVNMSSSQSSSEIPLNVTLSPPDIAVTSVTLYRTVIGQGCNISINVTVENQGDPTETFNVTAYANTTIVEIKEMTLASGNSTTITFIWNTSGWAKGNYTISAYAAPVQGETDLSDNTFIDGWVFITIQGDVDGDRDVDIYDVVKITGIYGSKRGDPQFNPNSDLDDDCEIKIYDVVRCTSHYGQSWQP